MMLHVHLPSGLRFGVQSITRYRPIVGVSFHPRSVTLWLGWFAASQTWFESSRREEAWYLNNERVR